MAGTKKKGGILIRRNTIQQQITRNLNSKRAMGESRHEAKQELKAKLGENYKFGMTDEGIHSYKTFDIYSEHCQRFAEWCIKEKGINKYTSLEKIKPLAKEYLKEREEKGLSLYTLKSERAALGKLYGEQIDYSFQKARSYDDITRSRGEVKNDKNFSEEKNRDLVDICRATGGRREDIEKLTRNSFYTDEKGQMWVYFECSKGGRSRISPVLPEFKDRIKAILETKEQGKPLFDKVHGACDVHGYRREYARALYEAVKADSNLKDRMFSFEYAYNEQKDRLLTGYSERNEPGIKGDMYISHSKKHQFKGNRDDIYVVSEALGHNRLEVSVNHYLKI